MPTAEEIRQLQKRAPFQAFNLHMTDGRTFAVRHSEQIMVFRNKIVLGLPEAAEIPERSENLSILHITSVEEIGAS